MATKERSKLRINHLNITGADLKELKQRIGMENKDFAESMGLEVEGRYKNLNYWYNRPTIPVLNIQNLCNEIGEEVYIALIEDIKGGD
jgi:hypothetical protein